MAVTKFMDGPGESESPTPALSITYETATIPFSSMPKEKLPGNTSSAGLADYFSPIDVMMRPELYQYHVINETPNLLRDVEVRIDESKYIFFQINGKWNFSDNSTPLKFDIPPSEQIIIVSLNSWAEPKTSAIYKENYFTPIKNSEYVKVKTEKATLQYIESEYFLIQKFGTWFLLAIILMAAPIITQIFNDIAKHRKQKETSK